MKIIEAFQNTKRIYYLKNSPPVLRTVCTEIGKLNRAEIFEVEARDAFCPGDDGFYIGGDVSPEHMAAGRLKKERFAEPSIHLKVQEDGTGWIVSSKFCYLFGFIRYLIDWYSEKPIETVSEGKTFFPAFEWQRSCYDYFLTQQGRIQRNFMKASYIRTLATWGFTHLEVNGLSTPMGLETGPAGEAYPMFYTYCPALDQFVFSRLNKGLYPKKYLSANLDCLKTNADLAKKYGLTPGLLCFEPRSVPDRFFKDYPMLRGARVDHPFRSFKPRYNMTITHPLVREHYSEMLRKLMQAVPELGFISIWTNDSGAGFEHTQSLYVGRNGGAYLIREWKDDEEIAKLAGENALRFFRLLRDTASEINPEFRVITRMESFYGEHETIWNGLGERIDVETASLIGRGWDTVYPHPRYRDSKSINPGTVYQQAFDRKEKSQIDCLKKRDSLAHYYFAAGPHSLFEPLLGIPYPRLTHKKLKTMHQNGVSFLAHSGGTCPPELVPYNINHEIVRLFQFDPQFIIDDALHRISERWAGPNFGKKLLAAWDLTEAAILAFPNIVPLYSTFGFTWYRLWVRPFVPNIEAIPLQQRRYYQDYMCTTPHNPNNVDLSRDVLFQLATPEICRQGLARIDENVWDPINQAVDILTVISQDAERMLGTRNVIRDQLIRLKALRCWFMTQRSVAAWIYGVYGYMAALDERDKKKNKDLLKQMLEMEIENTTHLLDILHSGVAFMAITDRKETPLIHGSNLARLLKKRLALMRKHMCDEPYIDPDYIEKKAAQIGRKY